MSHFHSSEATSLRMGGATIQKGGDLHHNLADLQIVGARSSSLTGTMLLGALLACGTLTYTNYELLRAVATGAACYAAFAAHHQQYEGNIVDSPSVSAFATFHGHKTTRKPQGRLIFFRANKCAQPELPPNFLPGPTGQKESPGGSAQERSTMNPPYKPPPFTTVSSPPGSIANLPLGQKSP